MLKNGNQNSSSADKESEESKEWNSESKTVLDYFTYGDKYELTAYNLQRNIKQNLPFPFSFSIFENLHTVRFNLQELGVAVGFRDLYKGSIRFHSVAASVKRIHD